LSLGLVRPLTSFLPCLASTQLSLPAKPWGYQKARVPEAEQPQGTSSVCQVKLLLTEKKSKSQLVSVDCTAEADTSAKYNLKYRNWLFYVFFCYPSLGCLTSFVQHMIGIGAQVGT